MKGTWSWPSMPSIGGLFGGGGANNSSHYAKVAAGEEEVAMTEGACGCAVRTCGASGSGVGQGLG